MTKELGIVVFKNQEQEPPLSLISFYISLHSCTLKLSEMSIFFIYKVSPNGFFVIINLENSMIKNLITTASGHCYPVMLLWKNPIPIKSNGHNRNVNDSYVIRKCWKIETRKKKQKHGWLSFLWNINYVKGKCQANL